MSERRSETRQIGCYQVDVSHNEQYVGRFCTANGGEHSAFVEMNSSGLQIGDVVMVSFVATERDVRRQTRLAEITRITDKGVVVVFSRGCHPDAPAVPMAQVTH